MKNQSQAQTGAEDLVSVIMVFFEATRFLQEAVDSVLSQTYQHWELILVDDGSTDTGPSIAAEYARLYPNRIRFVRHPDGGNHGTSAARNLGVRVARGDFIAFLDADDRYDPNRLAVHMEAFAQLPEAIMVQSLVYYWHSWDGMGRPDVPQDVLFKDREALSKPPQLLELLVETNGGICPACSVYTIRSHAVRAVQGFDEAFRDVYEDQTLLAKLYLHYPVLCRREYLAWYRQHHASLLHTMARTDDYRPGKPHAARLAYLSWLQVYLATEAPDAHSLRRAVHKHLRMEISVLACLWHDWRRVIPPLLRRLAEAVLPQSTATRLTRWWGMYKLRRARKRLEQMDGNSLKPERGGQNTT